MCVIINLFTLLEEVDFSGVPANITFAESSVCFQITITDDDMVENDEYFSLDMGVPYSVSTQLIGIVDIVRSTATMIIINDNDGELSLVFSCLKEIMSNLYIHNTIM